MGTRVKAERPAPQRAFVVNVHRLMEAYEFLNLLHELIYCFAITVLFTIKATSWRSALISLSFVLLTFALYADHKARYDRLDISDFASTIHLHPCEPDDANPNKVLKAMTVSTGGSGKTRHLLVYGLQIAFFCSFWGVVFFLHLVPCMEVFESTNVMAAFCSGHGANHNKFGGIQHHVPGPCAFCLDPAL